MKLKMWTGNLDGRREGLVIAPSKERARAIVGGGRANFDSYWTLQPAVDPTLDPEVLYTRPIIHRVQPGSSTAWQRGRCPTVGS